MMKYLDFSGIHFVGLAQNKHSCQIAMGHTVAFTSLLARHLSILKWKHASPLKFKGVC